MNFSKQQIADACRRHGVDVTASLIEGYDGAQLLWAICGNESSFGENCNARHEPAYDRGGTYALAPKQATLLDLYGSLGACSYGPMQVMLVNAPDGMKPGDFDDVDKAIAAGVYALNRLLTHNKLRTIAQIGACYNGGHVPSGKWSQALIDYANKLTVNYATAMPEEILQG